MASLSSRVTGMRLPPIVALLDISGSMGEYTRLFLHFLHAVTDARKRVHSFLFGTRLTNVTRALKSTAPDEALAACREAGMRLIDETPRRGIRDSRVAFLHPASTGKVLTEIVEPAQGAHP